MDETNSNVATPASDPQQPSSTAAGLGNVLDEASGKPPVAQPQQTTQKPAEQRPGENPPSSSDPSMRAIQAMIDAAVKPYADKLAKVESTNAAREQERRALDARDDYIRNKTHDVPVGLLRQMLPATTDEKVLHTEMQKVMEQLNGYVKGMVARGLLKYVDIGGHLSDGPGVTRASSPVAFQPANNLSPQQGLAAVLDEQRR